MNTSKLADSFVVQCEVCGAACRDGSLHFQHGCHCTRCGTHFDETFKMTHRILNHLPAHTFYPREELVCVDIESVFHKWRLRIVASLPDGYSAEARNASGKLVKRDIYTRKFLPDAFLTRGWRLVKTDPDTIAWRANREGMIYQAHEEVRIARYSRSGAEHQRSLANRGLIPPLAAAFVKAPPFTTEMPDQKIPEVPGMTSELTALV